GDGQLSAMTCSQCDCVYAFAGNAVVRHELNVLLRAVQRDDVHPHRQNDVVTARQRPNLFGVLDVLRIDHYKGMSALSEADDLLACLRTNIAQISKWFWSGQ